MHPTPDAVGEYARLGIVLEGNLQRHLDQCAAVYGAESASVSRLGLRNATVKTSLELRKMDVTPEASGTSLALTDQLPVGSGTKGTISTAVFGGSRFR